MFPKTLSGAWRLALAGASAASVLAAGGARAADLITNGGFEGGPPGVNQAVNVGDTTIPGWTIVNSANATTGGGKEIAWLADGSYGYNTPFDADYLDLTGYGGSTGDSGVSQTVATNVGESYTLTFFLGAHPDAGAISANVYAGAQTQLFSDPVTSGTIAGSTIWTQESFTFTATGTSTVLSIIGNNSGQDFIGLDNVALVSNGAVNPSAAPEPASWALMLVGFGGFGAALRRRRQIGVAV